MSLQYRKLFHDLVPGTPLRCSVWLVVMLVFAATLSCIAQPGIAELNRATADLSRSFFSARNTTLVLATLLGLCGAVNIYYNWQMGRDKVTARVAAWFFAAFFMILLGPFLQVLFGI